MFAPSDMTDVRIRTALISVSDKTGIVDLGGHLADLGIHLISTGGTHAALERAGVAVQEVAAYTGYPEMMDGRVKTLHPKIHGGLLGRIDPDGGGVDADVMRRYEISAIDLVVVNLYPFEQTVAKPGVELADAIENIDIGGPAMLRSAAKNFARVAVVVDSDDYSAIVGELARNAGCLSGDTRFRLAVKAFEHVAHYDVAISNYLNNVYGKGIRES